ncbi:LysR family transcriptional regulator [Erythrobacter sp. SD-21]|uniref:LysR family transcriptional regulator n=1 Tax=Erythrobacter sp. SD-21 TaxID=161528 RepID=UPI0012E9D03B|nr:LysR family transcriptional regulator [Erythrobacter sp. SD-21]
MSLGAYLIFPPMKWDDLRFVLAIARAGSLTKAAARLRVDQSTVGRHLSAIEAAIGDPLFHRDKSGFVPTEIGDTVIAEVEEMERAVDRLRDSTAQGRSGLSGKVRIATMPWILEHALAPRLASFWADHPAIEIQGFADLHERLSSRRETELSLRFELPRHTEEYEAPVANIPFSVYAAATADPAELPWAGSLVLLDKFAPQTWLDRRLEQTGETAIFRADDAGIISSVVRSGKAKALLPDMLGCSDPKLVKCEGYGPGLVRTLKLQVHPDVAELARVKAVIGWIEEVFRTHC